MDNWLAILINLSYITAAYCILYLCKFPLLKLGSSSHTWAVLFLTSVFFTIGLSLFDIPLGFWGGNNPHSIQRMKEDWWFFPLGFFILFLISLGLKMLIERKRNSRDLKPLDHMKR